MSAALLNPGRVLCALSDIPDGGAKGVEIGECDLILVRQSGKVLAYVNRCPHQGTPLETFPDRFLDESGALLVCSTHGARFRARDGYCVSGPCAGAWLEEFPVRVENGEVLAGRAEDA